MKSEIRNIRTVWSYGAYGKADHMGIYIYGKRPDGKTVRCKNREEANGNVVIWSEYCIPEDETQTYGCATEFTASEWLAVQKSDNQKHISNKILDQRKDK